ncbi:unnamed protein product [Tetraodon nigroviridis]|uniref:(spotted green pufferfish) hypothetical protein n=1 Tax=Tetraodon nigroviridis TaxID=99883 RepID=Q4RTI4_TETNG|nr:unnamed protein product [Tetraodon nigroviridis]
MSEPQRGGNELFGRVLEEVRRQIEPHSGKEEILRTAAKIIVLKEQEHLEKAQQHLQDISLLKADLQRATEEKRWMDEAINSLRSKLSDAEEELKKRDEKILSPQQFVNGHREEVQKLEQSWQQEVSRLKELLAEKDERIIKVEKKRRKRTVAYIDVLALLTSTQAALKDQEQRCAGLEEQHQMRLAEQQETFQKELQNREENFQKELQNREETVQKDLNIREEHLQKETAGGKTSQRPLKETLQMKEELWREQEASNKDCIRSLGDKVIQRQHLTSEEKTDDESEEDETEELVFDS